LFMKRVVRGVLSLAFWLAVQGPTVATGAQPDSGGLPPGTLAFGEEPMLLFTQPGDGDTDVATVQPLSWIFSTSMATTVAVQWSANVDPSKVVYSWGVGGQFLTVSYTGGWPGNTTINYVLNPPGTTVGFQAASGQLLPTTEGSFSTAAGSGGGGGNGNCQPGQGSSAGGFFMAKTFSYTQISDAVPLLTSSDEGSATFIASLTAPTNKPVADVTLRLPNGTSITLPNLFGTFVHAASFQTQAELDTAYPGGSYTLTVHFQSGVTESGIFNYPANTTVPVPRLASFSQLAAFVAAQAFTFRWDAFSGATVSDYLSFSANDAKGHSFYAPDLCVPRELPVTATSIGLPASTLSANAGNDGSLSFSKTVAQNQNFTASLSLYASLSRETHFKFADTTQPPITPPEFKAIERSPAGVVTLRLAVTSGANYNVEFSTDLTSWQIVHTALALSALETITHLPAAIAKAGFYRATVTP